MTDDNVAELFEWLDRLNLTPESAEATLAKGSLAFCDSAASELAKATSRLHETKGGSFSFVANSALSGERDPCSNVSCRLAHIERLSTFSVLYANRVLVQDPLFRRHAPIVGRTSGDELLDDIRILHALRPLLEQGLVRFSRRAAFFCAAHLEEHYSETGLDAWLRAAETTLAKRFISEVKVTVRAYPSSMYALEYLGPVELIEHGRSATLHAELPAPIARELSGRDQCVIPTDLAFECGLLDRPKKIIADMFVQNIYANWGYSYLTDRPVDLDIVHSLNEGAAAESAFLEGLNHALPAVFRIPTASLVSLRKKEPEAFLVFRDRLRVLLDQCHGLSKPQVEREFSNTILPELNRLEKLVQIEAEAARIDLARDAVGLGVVSVALFSGLLPPQLASLVASVGGFGLGKCLLDDVKRLIVLPEVAKRSDFYFLWRALEDRSIQQKL